MKGLVGGPLLVQAWGPGPLGTPLYPALLPPMNVSSVQFSLEGEVHVEVGYLHHSHLRLIHQDSLVCRHT